MKIWKKLRMFGVGVALGLGLVFGATGISSSFDKNVPIPAPYTEAIDNVMDASSFPIVQAIGTAQAPYLDLETMRWHEKTVVWSQQGSGTVVKDGYVITNAHVVTPDQVKVPTGSCSSYYTKPRVFYRDKILLKTLFHTVPARIHFIDHEQDVAILKYDVDCRSEILKPLDCRFAVDWREMEVGDQLMVITHDREPDWSMESYVHAEFGKILCLEPCVPRSDILPWFSLYDVTMDTRIIPGDSGSAVFAFRDGEPILVGFARAAYWDGFVRLTFFCWVSNIERYISYEW